MYNKYIKTNQNTKAVMNIHNIEKGEGGGLKIKLREEMTQRPSSWKAASGLKNQNPPNYTEGSYWPPCMYMYRRFLLAHRFPGQLMWT